MLLILFLGTFTMGSAELLVVGVLNLIAEDSGVTISTTGGLVTAYALGQAIGGPLLTAVTVRASRRLVLLSAMAAYVAVTAVIALSSDFTLLLAARVLTGALQGLVVAVAITIGIGVVPPERMGRAMSVVIGGFAVSTAFGVPLGTLVGQLVGWRGGFFGIVGVGILVLVAMLVFVPKVRASAATGFRSQVRHALHPRVVAVLGFAVLLFAGQFAVLTYLEPYLGEVTGISGGMVSVFLLVFGVANALGTFVGGKLADWNATLTMAVCGLALVAALGVLTFVGSVPVLTAVVLGVWGLAGFAAVPSVQYRVTALAGPGSDLAASLPASALNAGIAVGALVGGITLTGSGLTAISVTGLIICAVTVPVGWATGFLKPPSAASGTAARSDRAVTPAAD
ncbi:MFS transporter [Amycolatopsis circi]|uniref:MFS transporter n=1 Tax=Amycolatopsis circi TaxID=871959 RepID=UPI001ABF9B8C|nr:MFS transporter [Amycolatopsis circi]